MKNSFIKEIVASLVLIVLSILLLNPFHFWMPEMIVNCMLALLVASFALLSIFIMNEKIVDEREAEHRMLAGRVAFLVGAAVVTFGIIVQSFEHQVDPWLVISLVAMIISKFVVLIYSASRR